MTNTIPETISETGATMTAEEKAEHLRKRREVPLPALPGAFFTFGLTALGKLEEALTEADPGWQDRREGTVLFHIERQLLGGNPKMVMAAIDIGLKRKDSDGRNVPYTGLDMDELPFTVGEAVEAALPAIMVSVTGKTYSELLADKTETIRAYVNAMYQPPEGEEEGQPKEG